MNGNSLGVVLSPRVRLSRNEAEASVASRSAVERQPKRSPAQRRLHGQILRSSLNQSGGPTPLNINNASLKKPKWLLRHEAA